MKRLNGNRMSIVVVVIVAAIVVGGGRAKADFTFGEPVNLGPSVNTSYGDCAGCFSSDGLEMYMDSDRPGGSGSWDIWVTTRETINDDWSTPVNLGPVVNAGGYEFVAHISQDGLELYFTSNRPGGYGNLDMWVTKRATKDDAWGIPENLGPLLNSSRRDGAPRLSTDGLELFFFSENRAGGYGHFDIWVSRRATKDDPWEEAENLGPIVNSSACDTYPFLSSDGLLLFFCEEIGAPIRPEGLGSGDMWLTRRESISDPWGTPVNLGPIVNSSSYDGAPQVSFDGSMLYFCSQRAGGFGGTYGDIYQSQIIPIVDFNGDGIVDSSDMCIIVDHWGTDNQLCDIGPMPWGDSVVDVEDLVVLSEHLFEEVDDPTLLAHWKLDEEADKTAYDSVGTNDGVIIGLPQWRSKDGVVDGALELNGTTFIAFDPVLNPADGPFSVLVWVKGGGPGQVIASSGRTNWLMADAATGALMTELSNVGQNGGSLGPEAVITDGNWHRIAFTWDGVNARLYVDTLLEAEDAQDDLINSSARLLLGTSMDREPGTFWSGLIDDVRIYNRVVNP